MSAGHGNEKSQQRQALCRELLLKRQSLITGNRYVEHETAGASGGLTLQKLMRAVNARTRGPHCARDPREPSTSMDHVDDENDGSNSATMMRLQGIDPGPARTANLPGYQATAPYLQRGSVTGNEKRIAL